MRSVNDVCPIAKILAEPSENTASTLECAPHPHHHRLKHLQLMDKTSEAYALWKDNTITPSERGTDYAKALDHQAKNSYSHEGVERDHAIIVDI
eukprot:g79113.t1